MIPFSGERNYEIAKFELDTLAGELDEVLYYTERNPSELTNTRYPNLEAIYNAFSDMDFYSLDLSTMDALHAFVGDTFDPEDTINRTIWRFINAWENYRFWAASHKND